MISCLPESHREARQRRAAVYGGGKYLDGERKSRWQSSGSSREIPRVVSRGSARGALPRVLTIIIPLRRAHASRTREPKMIWSKEFENVNFLRRFTTSSTHCSVRFTLIFSDKKLRDFVFSEPATFIGRAPEQVEEFIEKEVNPILKRYADRLGDTVDLKV